MQKSHVVILAVVTAIVGLAIWITYIPADTGEEPPPSTDTTTSEATQDTQRPPSMERSDRRPVDLEEVADSPGDLTGWVFDTEGTPLERARVDLTEEQHEIQRTIYTDEEGRFIWPLAPAGEWKVAASAVGYDPATPVSIEHDEEIVLELPAGATITGRVVDPGGQPVGEYTIGIANADFKNPDPGGLRRRQMASEEIADTQGRFEYGPLESGTYRLVVTTEGWAPTLTDSLQVEAGDEVGPLTIQLEEGSTLTGTVRDADSGEPIEDARVVYTVHQLRGQPPTDHTDERGRYELSSIPSGRSSMRVFHDDYVSELVGGIEVSQGTDRQLDVELTPIGDDGPGQYAHDVGLTLRPGPRQGFVALTVVDESPADRAGMQRNDVVYGVDGEEVLDRTVDEVVELIRGEPGTTVSIDYYRSGKGHRTVDLERERIFLPRPDRVATQDQ